MWGHLNDAIMQSSGGLCTKAWYLDLLCKNNYNTPVNLEGSFSEGGKGVNVYILSTGVSLASPYLAERVFQLSGAEDTDGHGTALASIVGGVPFGVAKAASIYGLTLDYSNLKSSVDAAITIVLDHVLTSGKQAVVLIDAVEYPNQYNDYRFTGFYDTSISDSIDSLLARNITTVLCIKDGYTDESGYQGILNIDYLPPLSQSSAIIAAGMDKKLRHYSKSNYGTGILLYAPCEDIAVENLNNYLEYKSHADYAAALTAGVCALALSKNKNWGHKQVKVFLEEVARKNRVITKYSASSDAIYNLDSQFQTDVEGNAVTYTIPEIPLIPQSVLNGYFVKNELSINSDNFGTFECLSTVSLEIDITCRTVYGENRPYKVSLLNTDCSFLKHSKGRLYGFVPKHLQDTVYTFYISVDNGINAVAKNLTLTISSIQNSVKHASMKTLSRSDNMLDFDLVVKPKSNNFDLKIKGGFLKTSIIRPVGRRVAFYDHNSGKYSNEGESRPDTGDIVLPTNSDTLYAIVVENLKDEQGSNSRIINRIESE